MARLMQFAVWPLCNGTKWRAIGGRFLPGAVARGLRMRSFVEGFLYLLDALGTIEGVIFGRYVAATPSMVLAALICLRLVPFLAGG